MNQEVVFSYKTRGNSSPKDKPRVYFTCHPDDFERCFEKICEDIFKTHDCAIYYTEDMNSDLSNENNRVDLERINLFVIPVTFRLLTQPNRAMDSDFQFAMEKHIPILPFMMESDIDGIYSRSDKFGELQYLNPYSQDFSEISYKDKLKKYLDSVLISNEIADRIRKAFDAYVFLSYRKKDRKHANELMRVIHNNPEFRDIAVWFDEFLTPGENFRENIERILMKSDLFALLVTPNLLEKPGGKPNYVMAEEYPVAKKTGKRVLPAEMEETDKAALREEYDGIPECVDAHNDEAFRNRLLECLNRVAISENNGNAEHNYLIGLAYLYGIDVEVDVKRAVGLISKSAESEYVPAVKKLVDMYLMGDGVSRDGKKAQSWQKRLVLILSDRAEETFSEDDALDLLREGINLGDISSSQEDYDEAKNAYSDSYNLAKMLSFGAVSKNIFGKFKILFQKYILRNSPIYEQSILHLIKSGRMMLELSFAQGNFDEIVEWSKKAAVLVGAVHKQFESEETARELLYFVDRMSKECLESGNLTGAREWLWKGTECWEEIKAASTTRDLRFSASSLYDAWSEYYSVKSDYSSSFICQEKRWELLYGLHEELPDDYPVRYELIACKLSKADISRLGGDLACAENLVKQAEELISYEEQDLSLPVRALRSRCYLLKSKIAYSKKEYECAVEMLKQGYETLLSISENVSNVKYSRQIAEIYEVIGDSYHELDQNESALEWHKKAVVVISELLANSGLVKDTRTLARIYEKLLGEAIVIRDSILIIEFNEKSLWMRKALAEGTAIKQKTVGELIEKGKIESAFYREDIAAYKRILGMQDEIHRLLDELPEKENQLAFSFRHERIDQLNLFREFGKLTEEFVKTHKAKGIMTELVTFARDLKEIADSSDSGGAFPVLDFNASRCAKKIYDYILKLYDPFFRFDEQAMLLMTFCGRLYILTSIKTREKWEKKFEEFKRRFDDIVFLKYSVDDLKYVELWNKLWNWIKRDFIG